MEKEYILLSESYVSVVALKQVNRVSSLVYFVTSVKPGHGCSLIDFVVCALIFYMEYKAKGT